MRPGTIWTIVGGGKIGEDDLSGYHSDGDGGPALEATLDLPIDLEVDAGGDLHILEVAEHGLGDVAGPGRVRRVDVAGQISTEVGPPTGPGQMATTEAHHVDLFDPFGMTLDDLGNLYVGGGSGSHDMVIKVDPQGRVTRVAGTGTAGFSGDGGPATEAQLHFVVDLALDDDGNLYIADIENNRIRRVDPSGTITTFAGDGEAAFSGEGGPATEAGMTVGSLAIDDDGNVYTVDGDNMRVLRIDVSGMVETIAGTGDHGYDEDGKSATETRLEGLTSILLDGAGGLYVTTNGRVRRIDPSGTMTTIAGDGRERWFGDGGPAIDASFNTPGGMALGPDGALYVAEFESARVRMICPT